MSGASETVAHHVFLSALEYTPPNPWITGSAGIIFGLFAVVLLSWSIYTRYTVRKYSNSDNFADEDTINVPSYTVTQDALTNNAVLIIADPSAPADYRIDLAPVKPSSSVLPSLANVMAAGSVANQEHHRIHRHEYDPDADITRRKCIPSALKQLSGRFSDIDRLTWFTSIMVFTALLFLWSQLISFFGIGSVIREDGIEVWWLRHLIFGTAVGLINSGIVIQCMGWSHVQHVAISIFYGISLGSLYTLGVIFTRNVQLVFYLPAAVLSIIYATWVDRTLVKMVVSYCKLILHPLDPDPCSNEWLGRNPLSAAADVAIWCTLQALIMLAYLLFLILGPSYVDLYGQVAESGILLGLEVLYLGMSTVFTSRISSRLDAAIGHVLLVANGFYGDLVHINRPLAYLRYDPRQVEYEATGLIYRELSTSGKVPENVLQNGSIMQKPIPIGKLYQPTIQVSSEIPRRPFTSPPSKPPLALAHQSNNQITDPDPESRAGLRVFSTATTTTTTTPITPKAASRASLASVPVPEHLL